MKTKTVNGTNVEIVGFSGNNMVIVEVLGRNNKAQVNASDLILPEGTLPPEFDKIQFYVEPIEHIELPEMPTDADADANVDSEKNPKESLTPST